MDNAPLQPPAAYFRQGNTIITLSPQLLQSLRCFADFISLFPPGKMEQELLQLACDLFEKEENRRPVQRRRDIHAMYILLLNLCRSMQHVSTELAPLLKPWYLEDNGKLIEDNL